MPKFSVLSKEDARKNIKFAQTLEKNLRKYLHNLGAQVLVELKKTQSDYGEGGEHEVDIPFVGKISLKTDAMGFHLVQEQELLDTDSLARGTTKKLTQPWQSSISKHKRRLPSGRITTVRAHIKTYKPWYKPIKLGGVGGKWIVIDINKRIDQVSGETLLQDAWHKVRDSQDVVMRKTLPKDIETP